MQVAGNDGIEMFGSQSLSHLLSLSCPLFVQLALRLSLHHLPGIVHGLTVPYQIYFCQKPWYLIKHFTLIDSG